MGMPAAAFVINRTLLRDPRGFERRAQAAAKEHGWDAWFAETTEADGGEGLTRRVVAAGATLVFAAGGDGTVRACAGALAGTGMPQAIVPLGTANLTARALRVPARAGRAIDAGFGGRDRHIDLGRVDEAGPEFAAGAGTAAGGVEAGAAGTGTRAGGIMFAAMAGIGLDAAVVEAARPDVKRRLGWVAYAASGLPRLRWPACDFTVRVDDGEPVRRRARCVVVGNAGLLPSGFTLLPEARLDDGRLDVGVLGVPVRTAP
jgi:diacylglycerol kinase family enzyme